MAWKSELKRRWSESKNDLSRGDGKFLERKRKCFDNESSSEETELKLIYATCCNHGKTQDDDSNLVQKSFSEPIWSCYTKTDTNGHCSKIVENKFGGKIKCDGKFAKCRNHGNTHDRTLSANANLWSSSKLTKSVTVPKELSIPKIRRGNQAKRTSPKMGIKVKSEMISSSTIFVLSRGKTRVVERVENQNPKRIRKMTDGVPILIGTHISSSLNRYPNELKIEKESPTANQQPGTHDSVMGLAITTTNRQIPTVNQTQIETPAVPQSSVSSSLSSMNPTMNQPNQSANHSPCAIPAENGNVQQRSQKCSQCRYHKSIVDKKGHKRICPYKTCKCEGCILVLERQVVMKNQVALRRRQKEDDNRRQAALRNASESDSSQVEIYDQQLASSEDTLSEISDSQLPSTSYRNSSAFTPIQASSINSVDMATLQESLTEVAAQCAEISNPMLTHALYIAILKDNSYNAQKVIEKIREGEKHARMLAISLRTPPTMSSTPPPNYYPSYPNPAAAAAAATSLFPFNSFCYNPYMPTGYTYAPYTPTNAALSSAATHSSLETLHHPGMYSFLPTPSYSSGSPAAITPSASEVALRFSTMSPSHQVDGHTSGDSRGSADYKEESDKERAASAPGDAAAHQQQQSIATSSHPLHLAALPRQSTSRRIPMYDSTHFDRRQTAANA